MGSPWLVAFLRAPRDRIAASVPGAAACRISSGAPSIVTLDSVEEADGLLFITLELVMTGDLDGATEVATRLLEMQGGVAPNTFRVDPGYAPLLEDAPFRKVIARDP
ncbi:MAG TPA: hypothetical protein VGS03_07515 [Candidatus Polarisedimenticolia bacterium]|nr:hypothetical protein [Candidatus Polarisedimenticolia bacterium]